MHPSASHHSQCLNCAEPLTGPFCSQCGQHDIDHQRSFGHVLEESLEGFFHVDGKFVRTARWLFLKPGVLAQEYLAGRRVRYTPPLRLYIFASFLFFALQALIPQSNVASKPSGAGAKSTNSHVQASSNQGAVQIQVDDLDLSFGPPWLRKALARKHAAGELTTEAVRRDVLHHLPLVLFLCVPLFAVILKAVFFRSGRFYLEHLVVALQLQALVFLTTLFNGLVQWPIITALPRFCGFLSLVVFAYLVWAFYRTLRLIYRQGPWITAVKLWVIGVAYGFVLVIALLGALAVSLVVLAVG